tara:strand:- start:324 stop:1889 length:1566 start_codon:yes stop_codon:yes gene_type:complete
MPKLPILLLLAGFTKALLAEESDVPLDQAVQDSIPKLQALAEEAMASNQLPGMAIGVVYKDQVVFLEGYGTRRVGEGLPVDENTVFLMASLSKPMTTSIVAVAVGQGIVEWDDTIITYDPDFALSDEGVTRLVTINDLFSHRSGLPGHAGDKLEDLGYTREEILERLRLLEPEYSFRDGYAYTNFGFTQGAVTVAMAADQEWESMAEELMFQPLGMESTSFRYEDYLAAENRADIHVETSPGVWENLFSRNPDAQAPAGGLSTTINDYTQWMRMQLAEGKLGTTEIVDADALQHTWEPQSITGYNRAARRASFYGTGWGVGTDPDAGFRISHSGAFELGVRTSVTLHPDQELGIAVITNGGDHGIPEAICAAFIDYVYRGEQQRDWIQFGNESFQSMTAESYGYGGDYSQPNADAQPARDLESYLGTYSNPFWGDVVVLKDEEGQGLYFEMGPRPEKFPLQHWDGDVFLYQPTGEMSGSVTGRTSQFTFVVDEESQADQVEIEYYAVDSDGTFIRTESNPE